MSQQPPTDLTQPHNPPLSLPLRPGVFRSKRPSQYATLGELLQSDPEQLAKLISQAGPDGSIDVLKSKKQRQKSAAVQRKKTEVARHLVERTDHRGFPIILIETVNDDGSADVAKYK